jgi:hypothetical protein
LFQVECLLGKDHAKEQHDAQRKRNQQGAPLRERERTIAFIRLLFGHNTARASIDKIRGSPATHYKSALSIQHSAKNNHRRGREGRKGKQISTSRVRGERSETKGLLDQIQTGLFVLLCELCVLCGKSFG